MKQTILIDRKTKFKVTVTSTEKQAKKDLYRMVKAAELVSTL